ncbi:Chaperone dnaj-domain superfamily protein [Thalictrum thalictroides]|uniref:Chaperone dnaj-domain superfamily protein n=1 Tax=Thalictrum thalictroides TaxID=46969 RepID=A0A7J6X1N2_THATH|nr:Chaperone dnaj-domain superfamily protein [Thalictrum thalictroides]
MVWFLSHTIIQKKMGSLFLCNTVSSCNFSFISSNCQFPGSLNRSCKPVCFPSLTTSSFKVNCKVSNGEGDILSMSSAYDVLGVKKNCSFTELKAAFRLRVKQFHPDVRKDVGDSDIMIRRVIQAYEMLSKNHQFETSERECLDPFDEPECEATDVFVNETLCFGKGCSYSCVNRAPHAFSFASTGTARATSQGHGDDYQVQLAVGQCPRNCIHYVTPSQRIILEELLESILSLPYNSAAEADYLYSLITKATFENNRYQKPKREPMVTIYNVDMF